MLLSEWDTDYGRLLPVTFEKAFRETNLGVKVHRYSYLRGIDGKVPGEQERDDTKRPKNNADRKEKEDLQKLEEPLGKSQYDYLRRLAERISYLEEELKEESKDKFRATPIKAIGVLGSDFYDKYLVLQALGQRFPDRIFFTNDLDARYLHPANIEWTRNLVLASSLGLQLNEKYQGKIPPFRGAYQTSMFAATLRAFDRLGKTDFNDLKPRIFEIGRYNAIDLTERSENSSPINQTPVPAGQFPDTAEEVIPLIIYFIVLLSFFLWLLVLPFSSIRQVIMGVILLLTILIPVYIYSLIPSEEPFSLTEGISIWPTLIFRIIGIILSWVFFFYSIISLRKNCDTIANEFKLKKCSERKDQHTKSNIIMLRKIDYGDKINSLWQEYIRRGLILHRFKRTIFIVLIYIIITIFIVGIGGLPLNPVRGKGTSELYKYLLLINVISFYILTFFVFDAIRLFRWFVTCLQEKEMEWNETSLRQFGWKADMSKEALKERMLIRLIAKRTEAVGTLIYYPFIIWFIMFVARLHYFDNYHTPIGLAIVIFISPVFAWFCAVMLRRSAESLRAQVINRLEKHLISVRSTELWEEKKSGKETSEYIQWVIDETKANRQGAFAPFLQQPALQSLLVPFASIGGANLLDLLK